MNKPQRNRTGPTVSRRIAVLVKHKRDINTAIPKIIWTHELPILEALHGEGKVEEITNAKLNEHYKAKASANLLIHNRNQDPFIPPSDAVGVGFAFQGDMGAEYERMVSVYGRHDEVNQPVVEYVYGRFQTGRFTDLFCAGDPDDMPDAQLRQLIRGHAWVPVTDKDSSDAERALASERHKVVLEAPRERLLEIVNDLEAAFA